MSIQLGAIAYGVQSSATLNIVHNMSVITSDYTRLTVNNLNPQLSQVYTQLLLIISILLYFLCTSNIYCPLKYLFAQRGEGTQDKKNETSALIIS